MQGMTGPIVLDRPVGRRQRLGNDLATKHPFALGFMLGREPPEEINLQALNIEQP